MKRHAIVWVPCALVLAFLAIGPQAVAGKGKKAKKQKQQTEQSEPTAPGPDRAAQARALYAQGRYAEARPLLEELAAGGEAGGPLLYRLAYCRRVAGEASAADEAEQRAQAALETEFASSRDLEVPFYLVNAYQNQKRDEDARRVAAEATERAEQGDLLAPATADGYFQLGRLYADQGLEEQAAAWYAKAVDAFADARPEAGSYLVRASRHLAERAFRAKDWPAAARHYTTVAAGGEVAPGEWERLAVSRSRTGDYKAAAEAWRESAKVARDANHANYCAGITSQAARLGGLPAEPPGGKPWTDHTQAELEAAMQEQAGLARQVLAEVAQAETIDPASRAAFRERLREPRELLLAAALEYALRGHGIRETSFFGGYAPLLMKRRAWNVAIKPAAETEPGTEPETETEPAAPGGS